MLALLEYQTHMAALILSSKMILLRVNHDIKSPWHRFPSIRGLKSQRDQVEYIFEFVRSISVTVIQGLFRDFSNLLVSFISAFGFIEGFSRILI